MTNPKHTDTSRSGDLKPCPFCGGAAWLRTPKLPMSADCDDVQVSCGNCDTSGPPILFDQDVHGETDLPDLEAEAIAAWNARPADRIEALEAENERLRDILEQWLETAREYLDTEVAGRTFEALERAK